MLSLFKKFFSRDPDRAPRYYDKKYKSGGWQGEYHKHYSDSMYFHVWQEAVRWIREMDRPSILEIACGPGQFAQMLFENEITSYLGFDFSPRAIELARENNPDHAGKFTVENAFNDTVYQRWDCNLVIAFEFFEHIGEDIAILKKIRGGTNILFSVPNFDAEDHLRYFDSLEDIKARYSDQLTFHREQAFEHVTPGSEIFLVLGTVNN
ncbi:MAG: Ubiquinone biosynthesis O-methyltransferase [Candidatus Marinimicrobia bacterium]|nr:Ubiquinone biosynthesis O-methyltransferase [Candidatus Neomarinimicrobiota bacterium]